MIIRLKRKSIAIASAFLAFFLLAFSVAVFLAQAKDEKGEIGQKAYIKWVEFSPGLKVLEDTMNLDIKTYDNLYHISWIDSLSYLAVKN